jgi:endo-1,4-beta-xylanase
VHSVTSAAAPRPTSPVVVRQIVLRCGWPSASPQHRRKERMKAEATIPLRSRGRLRAGLLFASVVTAVAGLTAAAVTIAGPANAASAICSNQTGGSQGGYYQMWTAGTGTACMDLASTGMSYSTSWSGIGDFVAGAGWKPGSTSRTITYSGSLNASGGTALLTLYGWSTSPLIEYYVIENYVGSPPTAGTNMGTVTSDGGTYTIYKHQQVNQPSIQGTTTFWQYIAIRQSKRSSGTITFPNFVNAWASKGMNLGSMYYQIIATEAWGGGSGSSQVSYK